MEVKRSEMTAEIWDEWRSLIQQQECAECGAGLTIHTIPERAAMALSCSADHNHSGFRQRTCLTEEYRRGKEVYPPIRDNIEAKMMVKTELQRAMNLLALRFPDAIKDVAGAALFVNDCMRLGLDPLIQPAEAVPIPFRCKIKDRDGKVTGEKVTVAMIITEDGALSMAARGCKDEYDGAPATMTLMDYLMREHPQRTYEDLQDNAQRTAKELCDDAEAFVWVALGKRRSATEVNPVYGYYTRAEWEEAKRNRVPAAKQPGNQARVRAVKRWVRETYPEARQKMLEHTAELLQRTEGAKEAQEFIDAEYHFITDALISPPGQKAAVATKAARSHEGKKADNKVGESAQRTPGKQAEKPGGVKTTAEPSGAGENTLLLDQQSPEMATGREASAAAEGEVIIVDWDWFWDTLKQIKWTEDTCKTWMASHLQVDTQGDLHDIIPHLPRDKAEKLFRELQERADGVQRTLFE